MVGQCMARLWDPRPTAPDAPWSAILWYTKGFETGEGGIFLASVRTSIHRERFKTHREWSKGRLTRRLPEMYIFASAWSFIVSIAGHGFEIRWKSRDGVLGMRPPGARYD